MGGYFKFGLLILFINSLDLNDPPTAVGGVRIPSGMYVLEKDLNDPPTAVGGIEDLYFFHDLRRSSRT